MAVRTPNVEQKPAIEHEGGVLLSAGAGSGKTFVLVEHMIYLVNHFIEKNRALDEIAFKKEIRSYLSKIVIMTFTKKAAGELSLRLSKRVDLQLSETEEKERWTIAKSCFDSLTVGTIHSFCLKVIRQGLLSGIDPGAGIISEFEARKKVEDLFDHWYEFERLNGAEDSDVIGTIVSHKSEFLSTLVQIFADAELRLLWKDIVPDDLGKMDFGEFFNKCLGLMSLNDFSRPGIELSQYEEHKDKKWFLFLEQFYNFARSQAINSFDDLNSYTKFFENNAIARKPQKKLGLFDVEDEFDRIKAFRNFLVKSGEDLAAFNEHKEGAFLTWAKALKKVFTFIDEHYDNVPGITFSDLEYLVALALRDDENIKRIQNSYRYFIVDEFQDTSEIQYDILKQMVGGDHSKLFCVGDVKQAIYGFRGGEISVFRECAKQVPSSLNLLKNYRSDKRIIHFNNVLFDELFKKGMSFSGSDEHGVEVIHAEYPHENEILGKIKKIELLINEESDKIKKPGPAEINYYEAQALGREINSWLTENAEGSVCVLYKNLAPSQFLIQYLLDRQINFSAQVKIPMSEDPLVGLFKIILDGYLDYSRSDNEKLKDSTVSYCSLLLQGYLHYLGYQATIDCESLLNQAFADVEFLGPTEGFNKLIYRLGLSNSNYSNNHKLFDEFLFAGLENIESSWIYLNSNLGFKYSTEYLAGAGECRVQIMTAHASKGLEFDHVLLGGIHTNGRQNVDSKFFGKAPGSYKWKPNNHENKFYKSPEMIVEEIIEKRKDFSESKRLFYVACTRAVKQLSWVDLNNPDGPVSYYKNSWIDGIRYFENLVCDKYKEYRDWIFEDRKQLEISRNQDGKFLDSLKNNAPFFHRDNLGIGIRDQEEFLELGTMAELSVTKLSTLAECPVKFYLKNICKLDEELKIEENEKDDDFDREDFRPVQMSSSAERGTLIHDVLNRAVTRNFLITPQDRDCLEPRDIEAIEWVLENLGELKKTHQLISEQPVKFSIFGQMVNGIPDLVLLSDIDGQIWDYKTGKFSQEKLTGYLFQLRAYALAYYQFDLFKKDKPVKLVLSFVDDKKNYEIVEDYNQIVDQLYQAWLKLGELSKPNLEHCSHCRFGNICHYEGP